MARTRRRNDTFAFTWATTVYGQELEVECVAEYDLIPGERAIRYGDNACPGSDAEVQVTSVRVEETGEDVTALVDLDSLAEDILLEVGESERDAREAAAEDAADARRDR
jgi:hypothetical protein